MGSNSVIPLTQNIARIQATNRTAPRTPIRVVTWTATMGASQTIRTQGVDLLRSPMIRKGAIVITTNAGARHAAGSRGSTIVNPTTIGTAPMAPNTQGSNSFASRRARPRAGGVGSAGGAITRISRWAEGLSFA
jgi:hypothetical protein